METNVMTISPAIAEMWLKRSINVDFGGWVKFEKNTHGKIF